MWFEITILTKDTAVRPVESGEQWSYVKSSSRASLSLVGPVLRDAESKRWSSRINGCMTTGYVGLIPARIPCMIDNGPPRHGKIVGPIF